MAAGLAARSWLWGPEPFAVANEPYAGSPTGLRLVEYLDKGRMELNDPAADRESPWFVTSGLLVREMVQGQIQVGAEEMLTRAPAQVRVAGDAVSDATPTFAAFAPHLGRVQDRRGEVAAELIAADSTLSRISIVADIELLAGREFDEVTGHTIPAVFADWPRRTGPVYEDGLLRDAPLMDPIFVLGRPITEAYWVDATIAGKAARVLVQLFERRVLTYNPANPPEWRVEMGNVGRAYFQWRYGSSPPGPAVAARSTGPKVTVAGWNWPPGLPVTVKVELLGAEGPVGGPVTAIPDTSGYFAAVLQSPAALTGAVRSGANLRVAGEGAAGMVALPFRADPRAATLSVEGMLSHVEREGAGLRLTLTGHDGVQRRLAAMASTTVRFAEGGPAGLEHLEPGAYVAVTGGEEDGLFQTSRLDLHSVSGGGAVVGYSWLNESTLRVSGRGWPAGQEVAFGLGTSSGGNSRFAAIAADSRGNLTGRITLPQVIEADQVRFWLSAVTASPRGTAKVSMPLSSLGVSGDPSPPLLLAYTGSGGQASARPTECPTSGCVPGHALPLPLQSLATSRGEVVGLRPRWGPDQLIGPAPSRFAADLYPLAGSPGTEFTPGGAPAHSTGELPGLPLSLTIPQGMPPGTYVLTVRATWPGARGALVHAFLLEVR